ncbi:MAG: hypothetical protein AMXMBFR20_20330 [Planctomycetia bacterium]
MSCVATREASGRPLTDALTLLSIKDVARLLNVSVRHIERLDASGRIPAPKRVGRCKRWLSDDIQNWMIEGCPAR